MKSRTVLIVSLATNLVLMSMLAYIQSLSVEPLRTPAIIFYIQKSDPVGTGEAIRAASLGGDSVR